LEQVEAIAALLVHSLLPWPVPGGGSATPYGQNIQTYCSPIGYAFTMTQASA